MEIAIPKGFYDDHVMRELPAPPVVKENARRYIIDSTHPDMAELVDDCAFYCHPHGPEMGSWKSAAFGLRRTLQAYGIWKA